MIPIELAALTGAVVFIFGVLAGVAATLWANAPIRVGRRDDLSSALRELAEARDEALRSVRDA